MTGQDALELAGAVWTIARIVGPWVIHHLPDLPGLLGSA